MSYNFPQYIINKIVHYGQLAQTQHEINQEGNLGAAFAAIQNTAQSFMDGDIDAQSLLMANCIYLNIQDEDIEEAAQLLDVIDQFKNVVEVPNDPSEALKSKVAVIISLDRMDELYGKIYEASEDPMKGKNPDGTPDFQWGEKHLYDDLSSLEVAILSMSQDFPEIAEALEATEERPVTPPPAMRSSELNQAPHEIILEQNQEYIAALNEEHRRAIAELQQDYENRLEKIEKENQSLRERVADLERFQFMWYDIKRQFSLVSDVKGKLTEIEDRHNKNDQ